ncbi:hypothetical protein JTB14_037557 [Gonioctena quinquepunctata]|nr:hypothetical protein JTB14_037557 [Gonioctena quinquepunctata]
MNPPKKSNQTREKILGELCEEKMANTTIEETLPRTLQPATPKFIPPPTFNPGTDKASVFLRTYERTAIFLEGAANIWYNRYIENEENYKKTWKDTTNDFLEEYNSGVIKRDLEMRLLQRKQKWNENIREYFFDLQTLFYEYDPSMDPEEFRKFFENGISQEL